MSQFGLLLEEPGQQFRWGREGGRGGGGRVAHGGLGGGGGISRVLRYVSQSGILVEDPDQQFRCVCGGGGGGRLRGERRGTPLSARGSRARGVGGCERQ